MADTVRARSEILALLADNNSGAISPQDLRDAIVSLYDELDHDQTGFVSLDTAGAWITFPHAYSTINDYSFDAWGVVIALGIDNQYKVDVLFDWNAREATRIFVQPNEACVVFWHAKKVTV